MREFKNINELWQYCLHCPICKSNSRDMEVYLRSTCSVSVSWSKVDDKLHIICEENVEESYKEECNDTKKNDNKQFSLEIDCINNSLSDQALITNYDTYIYFTGKCNCEMSSISSANMFFDSGKIFRAIGIEQESAIFLSEKENFNLSLFHTSGTILFSKMIKVDHFNRLINAPSISSPIFHMNLDDHETCINKLKTIMVFG